MKMVVQNNAASKIIGQVEMTWDRRRQKILTVTLAYYRPTWPHLEGQSRPKSTCSTRLAGLAKTNKLKNSFICYGLSHFQLTTWHSHNYICLLSTWCMLYCTNPASNKQYCIATRRKFTSYIVLSSGWYCSAKLCGGNNTSGRRWQDWRRWSWAFELLDDVVGECGPACMACKSVISRYNYSRRR